MSVWVANRLLPMPSSAAWRDMGETCPPPSPRTSSKDEPGRSRWVCVPAAARVAVTRIAGLATFIVVATGMTAEPADADNVYAPARAAFAEGRYREAADLAETVGNATGYALAAESLAVEGHYLAGDELGQETSRGHRCCSARCTSPNGPFGWLQRILKRTSSWPTPWGATRRASVP